MQYAMKRNMIRPPTRTTAALLMVLMFAPAAVSAKRTSGKAKLKQRLFLLQTLKTARADALSVIRNESRYIKGDATVQREVTRLILTVTGANKACERMLMADLKKLRRKRSAPALNALQNAKPGRLNPWELALVRRLGDLEVLAGNHALPKTLSKKDRPSTFQLEQLRLTNEYRMLLGLQALGFERQLATAASDHSSEMRRLRYFDHTSPVEAHATPTLRAEKAGFEGTAVGENIAQGYRSPRAVHRGWLHSPGHHRNILSPTWELMGVAHSSDTWTQLFGRTTPNE
jgi:uncharacterized protein YkwD